MGYPTALLKGDRELSDFFSIWIRLIEKARWISVTGYEQSQYLVC
jgi:hypothetical protein